MNMTRFLLICLVLSIATAAAGSSGDRCSPDCPDAYFLNSTPYPMTEHIINNANITVSSTSGSTWTTIVQGCTTGTWGGQELRASEAFRLMARGWVKIDQATGAVGTRYELGLFVDGAQIAGVTKFFKPYYDTTQTPAQVRRLTPMTEMIAANWPDTQSNPSATISMGNHSIELKARMADTGSIVVGEAWIHAQGVPASQFSTGRYAQSGIYTIPTGSFGATTPAITVTNTTGSTAQIFPQAFFQYNGGVPGSKVETKFRLTEVGGLGRQLESSIMNVYVPCASMAADGTCTFPTGPRESQPILGPKMDVPSYSTWNLTLVAKAASSGTLVDWRYTDYTTLPAPSGTNNINNRYWQASRSTPITVATNTPTSPQPHSGSLAYWTDWTEILKVEVPDDGAGTDENVLASLYLDLYRNPNDAIAGNWQTEQITLALEVEKADTVTRTYWEWGKVDLPLNKGSQTQFSFTDSFLFGIFPSVGVPDQNGNIPLYTPAATIRLYMRKGYPVTGQFSQFEVRNARMDIKRVAAAPYTCFIRPPGQ